MPTVPHTTELAAFVRDSIARNSAAVKQSRAALVRVAGQAAMMDASAVIGGFDGITRIADATGVPLEPTKAENTQDLRQQLRINFFRKK